jgi:hypothetical protein
MIRKSITRYLGLSALFVLLLAAAAACAPAEIPPAVLEARDRYAEVRDIPAAEVQIAEWEEATWDDSCLEMGPITPEEDLCEEQETPGWRIVLEANDEQTTVRSDAGGIIVRWPGQAEARGADVTTDAEVFISLDGMSGVTASQEVVPFQQEDDLWEISPQHIRVTLDGYPVTEAAFEPQFRVYKVDEFEAARGNVEQILLEFQQIRASVPDVKDEWDTLVFVPLFQANQQFYAKPKQVDFQDGSGYRFLTQYGGEDEPVASDRLFYAYQGTTEQSDFIVTAILPVSHPDVGGDAGPEMVEEADPASFTPDLETLDGLIQSIVLSQSQ